ncbi:MULTISPECIES: SapB/AmfS family lantipeptide [Nocardiopsidaceae]|uniref:SapB/AmfS family lantipeptide n=2 Tax=Nocardiopsidaceae TaxID=83676 RepID=A0ABY6YM84_9ACTN|nr:SapB/AmfS family lantipeptide [Streptomonospora nanhaiensis]MEE2042988.1 SapB/AmfS family lantipeptide [Nocardiopsis tropica]WAE73418.1 SapB/AmfS family lantipeptide [Streptomonospora nanhaiensis]
MAVSEVLDLQVLESESLLEEGVLLNSGLSLVSCS